MFLVRTFIFLVQRHQRMLPSDYSESCEAFRMHYYDYRHLPHEPSISIKIAISTLLFIVYIEEHRHGINRDWIDRIVEGSMYFLIIIACCLIPHCPD